MGQTKKHVKCSTKSSSRIRSLRRLCSIIPLGLSSEDPGDVPVEFSSLDVRTFTNKEVNIVLDESNFLLWKQQKLLTGHSHRLEHLLTGKMTLPPKTVEDSAGVVVVNEEYEEYVAHDTALASWLLSTVSAHLLPQFVGAETTFVVWHMVLEFLVNQCTTIVMGLHYKLQSLRKGDDNMRVYLKHVKEVCDALSSRGNPVSSIELITNILKGLLIEYQPFMAILSTSREPSLLESVSSILIDVEAQLAGFNEQFDSMPLSANLARMKDTGSLYKSSKKTQLILSYIFCQGLIYKVLNMNE